MNPVRNRTRTKRVLPQSFFQRPALTVAHALIGKYLVRKRAGKEHSSMIVEVEAYQGENDLASHARFGRTERNKIMFEAGGHIYIYLIYGMHHMLNIVTGRKSEPSAILIRGVEGMVGPGRLTREFGINKRIHEKVVGYKTGLWFEDRGVDLRSRDLSVKKTPRIGVSYAGKWANRPFRFVLDKQNGAADK